MMRKKAGIALLSAIMTAAMGITSFAGSWQNDGTGWWWQNDNGGYPAGTWEWIDGNGDGAAESYYFDEQGYCLLNTATPDGYMVNGDGAWVVNGVVQTKNTGAPSEAPDGTAARPARYNDDYSGSYTIPCYGMDGSVTSQTITVTYNPADKTITVNYPLWGEARTYTYGGVGYQGFTFFELETEEEKDAVFFSAPGVVEWPAEGGTQSVPRF